MLAALRGRAASLRAMLDRLAQRRAVRRPFEMIHDRSQRLDELGTRMARGATQRLQRAQQRIAADAARLESLSPLAVLGRGYSLTCREDNGQVVRDAATLGADDTIVTRFARGTATSRVMAIEKAMN
jgi:exodeoxyribonuclease VII large subunit